MAASGVVENLAVGFEWTPFAHGFVFWEQPERLPPSDEAGQREGLEGLVAWLRKPRDGVRSSDRTRLGG